MIEFLNQNKYRQFNVDIARVLDLNTAIYFNELLYLNDNISDIKFDIDKIMNDTTLTSDQQVACKEALEKLNIIIKNESIYSISDENLQEVLNVKTKTGLNRIKHTVTNVTSGGKLTARQKQCNDLKNKLNCSNQELLEAYQDWIDGVYANPKGFLSIRAISIFQKTVDEFAKGDLDLALKIIDIATVGGYRDATWAINLFNKEYASDFRKNHQSINAAVDMSRNVKLGSDIF